MRLRALTDDDLEQSWALSRLVFGGDRSATRVQHEPPAGVTRAATDKVMCEFASTLTRAKQHISKRGTANAQRR